MNTRPTRDPEILAERRAARARRFRYDRRLRVLLNRQDWALIARDKAQDRLDAVERELAALDRWFLEGDR